MRLMSFLIFPSYQLIALLFDTRLLLQYLRVRTMPFDPFLSNSCDGRTDVFDVSSCIVVFCSYMISSMVILC